MSHPRHVNPRPDEAASAPYNFVPLPRKVLTAAEAVTLDPPPWKAHDRWLPGTHSGWIDLRIETLTPLFIRGPARHDHEHGGDRTEARMRPESWTTPDDRPAIPGSSLRGMLRTLVEILTFAKVTPVTDVKLFFRTFDKNLGRPYRERVAPDSTKPEGGLLSRGSAGWQVHPAEVLRVPLRLLTVGYRDDPNHHPDWRYQQQPCWVRRGSFDLVGDIRLGQGLRPGAEWLPATLVLTGSVSSKKHEYALLAPAGDPVDVPHEVWELFHSQAQITKWQEEAFPTDQPRPEARPRAGSLRDGEPVFFVREPTAPGCVRFLGRPRMFRFPYDLSPSDLIPPHLRDGQHLDLAEVLFGRVARDRGDRLPTIRGRVHVEDALAVGDRTDWYEAELVPRILGSPKPTTVAHYLVQDGASDGDRRRTYLRGHDTTIRGHKLYWHRWDGDGLAAVREPDEGKDPESSTQHTRIRPVRGGVTFAGRVRLDNVTDVELGALLTALALPEGCAHRLGMAKPHGLGSVRIAPALHLVDRGRRYRSWSAGGEVDAGDLAARCRRTFEQAVRNHADATGEPVIADRDGIAGVARIDALYRMARWDGRPEREQTRYLVLDPERKLNEFRKGRILPTPHAVTGTDEPTATHRPPGAVLGTALGEETKGGRPKFTLPTGRTGYLLPHSAVPPDLARGQAVWLIVKNDPGANQMLHLVWADAPPPPATPARGETRPKGNKKHKKGR